MSRRTFLRDHHGERYSFQLRLLVAITIVLVGFGVLLSRFVFLQVLQYDKYHTLAESNRISLVPIPPSRGIISDRNGVVLAHNFSAYTLEITPSKLDGTLNDTVEGLAALVDITAKDRRRFKKLLDESKDFESLPIKTRLSDEEVARFAANAYRFPGVEIKARLFRHYPMGESASHLIGYIGRINDQDLKTLAEEERLGEYKGTDHMGKFGLEQSYESELHGKTGYEQVEVDSGSRAIRSLHRSSPIAGDNLTLTIDIQLQQVIEQAFGEHKGALVAIDPTNGGILAMVSRPGFDPNLFVDGIDPVSWRELNESAARPLNNRAIQGTYPPGSTFKPFMALAALETGKRRPSDAFLDPGFFTLGNHRWRDDKVGGHGYVDLVKSIVVSCDTYYYRLANDMGIDLISGFMGPLGLGHKTGVDLPNEKDGILPSQAWKRRYFKRKDQQRWLAGDTISIGIGQGYNSFTIMQLAQATSTLVNDGVQFRPHLVRFIENSVTSERREVEPQPRQRLPYKSENIEVIKRAMVETNRAGTGAPAFSGAPYTSGGKTGTAQVYNLKGGKYNSHSIRADLRDHALFIAFAPADKPKIALAMIVENGGFGGKAAAPIARTAFDYYLQGKRPVQAVTKLESSPAEEAEPVDGEDANLNEAGHHHVD
ncbi:penicillin-binding protein 2 [Chitinimonas sp. BJB300]|uniref:penicillin-binding protein 2 n=1 Tax=Chitinimonas sp. BJB300 TaxID=1559339 RepID=UPI000C11D6F2|nr:penicillin-binding protein 2 [Chitinimonas sp. BJB300]PHV12639.1 penicillin-binding protein 2 [Chitinimonas sp. BJB300]TSJ91173.1 penicillin-binding protein 2 [Chitinimonas sp. BJB300]